MTAAMRALSNVDAGVVKAEIEIAATPDRVFQSRTDANELAAWWGSDDMYRTSDWKIHLRPGDKWSALAIEPQRPQRSENRISVRQATGRHGVHILCGLCDLCGKSVLR